METMKAPFRTIYSNDLTNVLTCVSPYNKAEGPYRQEMLDATVDETAGRADVHMLEPALGWVRGLAERDLPGFRALHVAAGDLRRGSG